MVVCRGKSWWCFFSILLVNIAVVYRRDDIQQIHVPIKVNQSSLSYWRRHPNGAWSLCFDCNRPDISRSILLLQVFSRLFNWSIKLEYTKSCSVKEGRSHARWDQSLSPFQNGASITLEPGGQLELSGAPFKNLHETMEETLKHLDQVGLFSPPF